MVRQACTASSLLVRVALPVTAIKLPSANRLPGTAVPLLNHYGRIIRRADRVHIEIPVSECHDTTPLFGSWAV